MIKNATNPKQITANLNIYSRMVGINLKNKYPNAIKPITSNIIFQTMGLKT